MSKTLLRSTLLLAGALAACDQTSPSKSVPTHEIYPRFAVETDADGVSRINAQFARHYDPFSSHWVSVSGGDALIVTAAGQEARFEGPGAAFETTLQTGIATDTLVRFDFQRPKRVDAPDSIGYLPAPMDLTMPAGGEQYTIGTDVLLLTWDESGTLDDMWVEIDAICTQGAPDGFVRIDIAGDPGLYAVRLEDHFGDDGYCTEYRATVTLARERDGAIDSAFAPNEQECGDDCDHQESLRLRQVRSATVGLRR